MALNTVQHNAGFHSLDQICTIDGEEYFCAEVPINSSEYYQASMQEIRPTVSLLFDTESLPDSVSKVIYKGKTLVVYRRYASGNGLTQLYCEERAGVR